MNKTLKWILIIAGILGGLFALAKVFGGDGDKTEKVAVEKAAKRTIIETVNAYYEDGEDGFGREVSAFGACCGTEDFIEGATAFVEKRKANFTGR